MNAAETGQSDSASMAQTIYTEDRGVACDGGGGALGHPQVWLTLGGDGEVTCPIVHVCLSRRRRRLKTDKHRVIT